MVDSYTLPPVPGNHLLQQVWNNLKPLLSLPDLPGRVSPERQPGGMLVDPSLLHTPRSERALLHAARHLVYKIDDITVDLLIGPMPKVARVELIGQVLGDSPGKLDSTNLQVVLVNSSRPVACASTNQLGEFHMEFEPEDHLAVRIRVGPDSWIETPLRDMAWVGKSWLQMRT